MTEELTERVRRLVYRELAGTGRAPSSTEAARRLEVDPALTRAAYDALAAQRHVVLDEAGSIVMAHPFATVPLGFSVMGPATLWWGGCAWDSFAIPHLVPEAPSVLVATTCPACARPHAWTVTRDAPPEGGQVAHFLTPVAHIWDDVVHTCAHQRLFCDESCVDAWLASSGSTLGCVMSLDTLWHLASGWYAGRLDSPYTRREPDQAAAYFSSVGLRGNFWGLPG